ncbi:SET domain-containing protein [Xylariomycetidae sp. FL2044]|nr:SET domain-containing protein [Xylariomycetidae sp. FL2044]
MDTTIVTMSPSRALSSESSFGPAADTFDHVASLSSTPPTTVADSVSLASDSSKHDHTPVNAAVLDTTEPMVLDDAPEVADSITASADPADLSLPPQLTPSAPNSEPTTPSSMSARPRRSRMSAPIYNLAKLAGTAIHGKRRSKGDDVADRKRRTTSQSALTSNPEEVRASTEAAISPSPKRTRDGNIKAAVPKTAKMTPKKVESPPRRVSTRSMGASAETLAEKLSNLGKKGKKTLSKMSREMRRLADTDEFAHIDKKPVLHTVWANGKYVDPNAVPEDEDEEEEEVVEEEPPKKKAKTEHLKRSGSEFEVPEDEGPVVKPRQVKKYLDRGLYAGQEAPMDIYKGLTPSEKKTLASLPELMPNGKPNSVFPPLMYGGLRLLIEGRDYKLPFDVCNPLPPGQPKPEEWKKMTKNRFVGDAAAYWKKTPHFKDYQSKCVCTPEDGCGESCQNRIMLYECDETNCNVGIRHCQNRAFAQLQERTKQGGKFRVGVEVIKTGDRGYGIRANRPFKANQIIMEYTGEIITEEECDRRMNEKYKDNKCYYLMSFDQNMIIDATTGSIARFVNHSCTPNSRMIKWIVSGQPRMALFAGDRDIMTGEELTYDYNFDPFSAKNVQKCLCGSANCRGVLGPKPKEVKPPKQPKEDLKKAIRKGVSAGKRKLKELVGDDDESDDGQATKKRKIKTPSGIKTKDLKKSISNKALKAAAKSAAKTVIKRSVATIAVNSKAKSSAKSNAKSPARKIETVRKSKSVVKTYGKAEVQGRPAAGPRTPKKAAASPKKATSRKSSLTIVAAGTENAKSGKGMSTPSSVSPRKGVEINRSGTKKIRLVNSPSA